MSETRSRTSASTMGSALDEILAELCDAKRSVLLATPYFAISTRLLERRGDALALRAHMSAEALRHALGNHPLKLRFPWDLTMYAGAVDIVGFEQEASRKILLVSVPSAIGIDERRGAWRLDYVGRSRGALGSGQSLIRVNLENLSAAGAGLFCLDPITPEEFHTGRLLNLELTLDKGPLVNAKARITHGEGQSLGVAFQDLDPVMDGAIRTWIAPRRKEAQRAWDNRATTRAAADAALKPKAPPTGLLLVTSEQALAEQEARLTEADYPLRLATPALGNLKKTLEAPPLLLLLDISGAGLDTRHRMKAMMDALGLSCPVVVIAQGQAPETLRSFATEIKAAWSWEWNPNQGPFFQRLIKGIIRRHWKAESPAS